MRRIGICVLVMGFALGCSAAPRGLAWTIDFESTALRDQARVVDGSILRGSCTGTSVFTTRVHAGASMTMTPPVLAPGTYAFSAIAYDANCNVIANDCQSIVLPGPPAVTNLLRAHAGGSACPMALCRDGACEMDSGMPDVGVRDGGPNDVGPNDVGMQDAVVCAASESGHCGNATDDDCDGHTDCGDSDCASDMTCARCVGVTCGACMACNPANGMCGPAPDGDACPGGRCAGGACCSGCMQGTTCQPGTAAGACGAAGGACGACGECTSCSSGVCMPSGNGSSCASGNGHCAMGTCCMGCIGTTGACVAGTAMTSCGNGGRACTSCSECQSCTGVGCLDAMDGNTCSVGRCLGGRCCNGCFIVGTCQPGDQAGACGPVGGSCVSCGECQTCGPGRTCMAVADGSSCAAGAGMCSGGTCCTGCVGGGLCHAGNADDVHCGFGGNTCGACPTGTGCSSGVCVGAGDGCGLPIDLSAMGMYAIPIDTCARSNHFDWPSCASGVTPPGNTADVVFRGPNPGTYSLRAGAGWTVGSLADSGSCVATNGACADAMWGVSGSTGFSSYFFGLERTAGGCGRVTVYVTHN